MLDRETVRHVNRRLAADIHRNLQTDTMFARAFHGRTSFWTLNEGDVQLEFYLHAEDNDYLLRCRMAAETNRRWVLQLYTHDNVSFRGDFSDEGDAVLVDVPKDVLMQGRLKLVEYRAPRSSRNF